MNTSSQTPTSDKPLSSDPFAPRLTPTFSATLAPPTPTSQTQSLHTPRSVSISMEDYMADPSKEEQELDLNMVHDFGGEGLGVDMRDFTHHVDENDHDHDHEQDHEIDRDHGREHEGVVVDSKDGMLGESRSCLFFSLSWGGAAMIRPTATRKHRYTAANVYTN
ncbi:hypothetical protein IAT40_003827 [Kwoniella sp. CBS 6097]